MKAGKNKPTDNQITVMEKLSNEGYRCAVCWTFDQFKAELIGKGFLNPTDEDVLSYALFPQVAEEFFKKHYQSITAYRR